MSKDHKRTVVATVGGCLVVVVIASVCIAIALVLYWQRNFLYELAFRQIIPLVNLNGKQVPPTEFPLPSATPNPNPAQLFSDPILAQITNRPPDFQDDFSNPSSGWEVGRQNDKCFIGLRSVTNGYYDLISDPASPYQIKNCDGYGYTSGSNARLASDLKNYVFEVEQTWIQGSGWAMINLQDANNYGYSIRLRWPGKNGGFWLKEPQENPDTAVQFTNDLLFSSKITNQSYIRIMFILQGEEFAILADERPIYYSTLSGARRFNLSIIEFRILTGSSTDPFEIQWDNLKIWDLNR